MSDRDRLIGTALTPEEGAKLVAQAGVRVVPRDTTTMLSSFGDEVLFDFVLPNGDIVEYRAEAESDYYGGHYTNIYWTLWTPEFPE